MEKGLIHLYCGDGKGKTTAAIGLCIRAAGRGMRVGVAQFLKNGDSGELKILSDLKNVRIFPFLPDVKFTFAMSKAERSRAEKFYTELVAQIKSEINGLDLLILDEAADAVAEDLISLDGLLNLIQSRPPGTEIVVTGRKPQKELSGIADYISEIRNIRHPYQKGVPARKGIEW
jgi:cob(I)alamin adenosyltransferase